VSCYCGFVFLNIFVVLLRKSAEMVLFEMVQWIFSRFYAMQEIDKSLLSKPSLYTLPKGMTSAKQPSPKTMLIKLSQPTQELQNPMDVYNVIPREDTLIVDSNIIEFSNRSGGGGDGDSDGGGGGNNEKIDLQAYTYESLSIEAQSAIEALQKRANSNTNGNINGDASKQKTEAQSAEEINEISSSIENISQDIEGTNRLLLPNG
jgi:hypothetical protein